MSTITNFVTRPLGPNAPLVATGWRGSSDPLTAVMDGGEPAVRITESADGTGLYLDPSVNFTANVGDTIRLDVDVKAGLVDHASAMRLRISAYDGAFVTGGTTAESIVAGRWMRLSVEAVVTAAPAGHYFRTIVWPNLTTGSPEGAWLQVRRAVVQIGPDNTIVRDGIYRDGNTVGWKWNGAANASTSTGPAQTYVPDGSLSIGGQRLDWLDAIADLEETSNSRSTVLTTLNSTGTRHHVFVSPAGPAAGRLTLRFTREIATGDPGARAQIVADSLLTGGVHTLTYNLDISGADAFAFVPTGAVVRRLEVETAHHKRAAVWTVEVDYTRTGGAA